MTSRFAKAVLLAVGLLMAAAGPAASDLVITLKDGRVIRVPIEAGQVESLTFEAPGSASQDSAGQGSVSQDSAAPDATEAPAPAAVASDSLPALVAPVPPATRSLDAAPIQVGPTRKYKVPSQAARVALDGSVIEIDAGSYPGDVAVWTQSNLTIRAVGGRAHIDAQGNNAGGKAIWVIRGGNVTVDGIELSGCQVPDRNGAGIRLEGPNFTLRNSYIHDNQMGILTDSDPRSDILIENSEFANNTVDYEATGSLGHNIYIGKVRSFTLRGSYVHGASYGHNVKSRAANNYVMYNRIMDGAANSSYLIDLSEGGNAYVIGNLLHQSKVTDNSTMIGYATEGGRDNASAEVYVVNNTAVSDYEWGILVRNHSGSVVGAYNNVFVGGQTMVEGPSLLQGNVVGPHAGLADAAKFDYRLAPRSPAIDTGVVAQSADGQSLLPTLEYRDPPSTAPRPRHGVIDAGAFEAAAQ